MKPHQLRIEAFGPYAEPVEIGFDALSQEGLFLIHGTTGAGKTFLLDALCFALYGEVSGDRSIKALKSDHAAAAAVPRVCLEFSAAGGRYRVERSPAYAAPKARGTGTTEKAAQAVLFRVKGEAMEPIASRTTEVTREVEGLVGLTINQFRQVILLPQGRFAEVLRARAEEREALLKTLFNTVLFEQAAGWLDERAKAGRITVAEHNRQQEVLQRQAAQAWQPYASGELSPVETDADGKPEPASQDPAALVPRIAAVVAAREAALQAASAALLASQRTKAAIDQQADRWDRRAAASTRLQELEGKQEAMNSFRQRLQRAQQAEQLRSSLDAEEQARQALAALQQQIEGQLLAASRAREASRALPTAVQRLELRALPNQEALGDASNQLAARRAELKGLAARAQEAAAARSKAAAAEALAAQAQDQLNRSRDALGQAQQARQRTEQAYGQACSARDGLSGLKRTADDARARLAAVEALGAAEQHAQACLAAKHAAEAQLLQTKAALLDLRERQIAGMAARLAAGLQAGAPCPVCGSSHHPAPAHPADDAVSDTALVAAEQALGDAGGAAEQAAVALAKAQGARQVLLEKAGDAGDRESARTAAQQAAAALAAAEALAAQVDHHERAIRSAEAELQALQTSLQAAGTEQALQARIAADETERAETLTAAIASELGEGVDPQQVLHTFAPLEAALKTLAASCAEHTAASSRLEQASDRLAQELAGSAFADPAAAAAALRDAAVREHWAERIQAFDTELIEQRGILAAPDLTDLPEQRPDTAAAQAAVASADAARIEATKRDTQARGAQAEIQRLAREHRQGAAELAKAQQQAQLLSAVADRCSGRAAPFISLQRWVLSAYLGEICGYANQRLELMTSGRYQLRLSDGGIRGGRQAGLGLRVLDAYTGEEREVNSLSGGETFQASLALALGVADTVQAHTGGVQLDALFIDEGFGTLDPDNLQLAMDELDRLREGGRMIGIISHVGALKERIRSGIEVIASDQGSSVRVGGTEMV